MNTMHLFNRALANAGPMAPEQRKAMFFAMKQSGGGGGGGKGGGGGAAARDQSGIGPGTPINNPSPALKKFMDETQKYIMSEGGGSMFKEGFRTKSGKWIPNPDYASGQTGGPTMPVPRGGSGDNFVAPPPSRPTPQPGMSLTPTVPGMMYPAVMPPAGTHWEYDPNGGRHPVRDGMVTPGVQPRDPGQVYTGGNPDFDERTGQYRDPSQMVGGPAPVRGGPNAPIVATNPKNGSVTGGRVAVRPELPGTNPPPVRGLPIKEGPITTPKPYKPGVPPVPTKPPNQIGGGGGVPRIELPVRQQPGFGVHATDPRTGMTFMSPNATSYGYSRTDVQRTTTPGTRLPSQQDPQYGAIRLPPQRALPPDMARPLSATLRTPGRSSNPSKIKTAYDPSIGDVRPVASKQTPKQKPPVMSPGPSRKLKPGEYWM